MDLQSIDPRAASPAASGRDKTSSSGGAFQGVMQMMAEIAANRSERQVPTRSEPERSDDDAPRSVDESKDRDDDAPRTRTADERDVDVKDDGTSPVDAAPVIADASPIPAGTSAETATAGIAKTESETATTAVRQADPAGDTKAPAATDVSATSKTSAEPTSNEARAAAPADAVSQNAVPQNVAPQGAAQQGAAQQAAAQQAAQAARNGIEPPPAKDIAASANANKPAVAAAPAQTKAPTATPAPATDTAAADPRQTQTAAPRTDQSDLAAKAPSSMNAAKPETGSGRADALMGAKVTVETPTPIARSQGVSSAVLVQAQQAAAGAQPQAQAAGNATPLHVGANQPTFVGADGNQAGGQNLAGQNSGGQNTGGQNTGSQNAGAQNNGQGGAQANQQQVGVSFGATIGQRGFGGESARAQFQEILATRTARPQPAALAGGEAARPLGATTTTSSSTPMTMAGISGPQSTDTFASSVNRAAATAHGRPGATLGTPADQVAVKLSATAKDGGGRVTVRLNPEELGKVDIKMEIAKDGMVRAVVSVERPETLELLQKDARGLEKALQDAGLQTDGESLEFDLRGDGSEYAGDADGETGNAPSAKADAQTHTDDGDAVADGQDDGGGGVKADGSLDLVA